MKEIFGIPYFNLKRLCRDIKEMEEMGLCDSCEITISYFKKGSLYFAQKSFVYMPGADEKYRANFLIHFKGNKKRALNFLHENDLRPRNAVTN